MSHHQKLENRRISNIQELITPVDLSTKLPAEEQSNQVISQSREIVENILLGNDKRLLVIVGPCSIHNTESALEYAEKMQKIAANYPHLHIVMRVYFEKPRTTIGWKGLINDPNLNYTFDINKGLKTARQLLLDINQLGISAATEFLDTISPQYIADLVAWGAIGARTTESQVHRELASGLSMPIGFKNGTRGTIQIAIDAIGSAKNSHHFLSVANDGKASVVETQGNPYCHVILRGGGEKGPNYHSSYIQTTEQKLRANGLLAKIMIDASHGNSNKDYRQQINVIKDINQQISAGNQSIFGVMIESNLQEGAQSLTTENYNNLVYGQSITDSCVGWEETLTMLDILNDSSKKRSDF